MNNWSRRSFMQSAGVLAGAAAVYELAGVSRAFAATDGTLGFSSGVELAAMLRRKEVSSVELTRYFIGRIERFDGKLNAIPVRDFERALDAAKAADAALAKGNVAGPLHGLPMTIKESFNIAGLPTTWGIPDQKDFIAAEDSAMVTSYKQAGAHFMGKTNVPLLLGDFQSFNDIYGTTNNPWNTDLVPGGSSGGTAAALAAGMTGLDSGSDIGGSIRNPAHFCGVYGHKPTWGVVPPQGHAPPGLGFVSVPDLAVVGPLARSAEDIAAAMDIIAGPDVLDSSGWRLELPAPRMKSLGELRVALWPDHGIAPVEREVADRVAEIGQVLARKGAKVSDVARPAFSGGDGHETYMKLLLPIVGGPDGNTDHQSWMGQDNMRTRYRMAWQEFFKEWDILVCPIMPTTAFPHDHSPMNQRTLEVNGEPIPYLNQVFWAGIATMAYLPSTVFPTGLSKAGLPIGLQAIGGGYDDRTTIEFSRLMAQEIGGFIPPPGYGD